jgi:hypothetical protein
MPIGMLALLDIVDDIVEAVVEPIAKAVVNLFLDIFFEPFARVLAWMFVNFILRFAVAVPLWNLNKVLILIALGIAKFTEILIDYFFVSAFNVLAEDFGLRMLPLVFTIALTLLGMTYVLAAWWIRSTIIVDWKKAFAWLLFAWLFYTFGAEFFVQSYIIERTLGTVMYGLAFDVEVEADEALGPFADNFDSVQELPPPEPEDVFGQTDTGAAWLKYDESIDGVDVAMAFFYAEIDDLTTIDILALSSKFDQEFFGGIGDLGDVIFADKKSTEILAGGINGCVRLFFGIFINVFAILDQVVSLWIVIGLALTFFMLLWVVLLAFFNATEPIARYLVRSWLDFMLLALFSGIVKAIGVFVMLLASNIAHPLIWVAGAALGLAIGWMANKQAIDGVMQLMKNIQGSVSTFSMTGGMQVLPSQAPGMGGGMGGMGGGMGGRMGGMGGGMGGMASMNPKMMAAQAALGAVGGSAGQRMGGGGFGTSPTAGLSSLVNPNYGQKNGMMMHSGEATSPRAGLPTQGAMGRDQFVMSPGGKPSGGPTTSPTFGNMGPMGSSGSSNPTGRGGSASGSPSPTSPSSSPTPSGVQPVTPPPPPTTAKAGRSSVITPPPTPLSNEPKTPPGSGRK